MTMIQVSTEIAQLLGLPPDVDDATLSAAVEEALARQKNRKVAAARNSDEERLVAEDKRIVAAAIDDGRLSLTSRERWLNALESDRATNRTMLASLAPGLRPTEQVVADVELEQMHGQAMARLGITDSRPSRTVAAASPQAPRTPSGASVHMLGMPLPGGPAPIRIVRGKPPAQWTAEDDQSGPGSGWGAVSGRAELPPGSEGVYQPSPNDTYEWVETGNGQGEFGRKTTIRDGSNGLPDESARRVPDRERSAGDPVASLPEPCRGRRP